MFQECPLCSWFPFLPSLQCFLKLQFHGFFSVFSSISSRNQICWVECRQCPTHPNSQNLKRLSCKLTGFDAQEPPAGVSQDRCCSLCLAVVRSGGLALRAVHRRWDRLGVCHQRCFVRLGPCRAVWANGGDCKITSLRAPSWKNSMRILIWLHFDSAALAPHHRRISCVIHFGGRWCQLEILWWPSTGRGCAFQSSGLRHHTGR